MTKKEMKGIIDMVYSPVYKTLDDITVKLTKRKIGFSMKFQEIYEYGISFMYLDEIGAIDIMKNTIKRKYIRLPSDVREKLHRMKQDFNLLFSTSLYIYKPEYFSDEDIMYLSFKTDKMGKPYAVKRHTTWLIRCLTE